MVRPIDVSMSGAGSGTKPKAELNGRDVCTNVSKNMKARGSSGLLVHSGLRRKITQWTSLA